MDPPGWQDYSRRHRKQKHWRMAMVRTKESRIKVKLSPMGFFRELPHGDPTGPSLHEAMRDAPGPHEREIVEYLSRGVVFIMSPGPVQDVIDNSGPIGTASVCTDGVWAWSEDLPHYVERYHVVLPKEFIEHAARNNWQVPGIPNDQLRRLSL